MNEFESKATIYDLPKKYYEKTYSNFLEKTKSLKAKKEKCFLLKMIKFLCLVFIKIKI